MGEFLSSRKAKSAGYILPQPGYGWGKVVDSTDHCMRLAIDCHSNSIFKNAGMLQLVRFTQNNSTHQSPKPAIPEHVGASADCEQGYKDCCDLFK